VGGEFVSIGGLKRNYIARLDAMTGAPDSFDPNANGSILTVVVQPNDGKILIGGYFSSLAPNGGDPVVRNRMARLDTGGTVESGFDPDANAAVESIDLQTDGNVIVGGQFEWIGGEGP
jgi:hypothetical protein